MRIVGYWALLIIALAVIGSIRSAAGDWVLYWLAGVIGFMGVYAMDEALDRDFMLAPLQLLIGFGMAGFATMGLVAWVFYPDDK